MLAASPAVQPPPRIVTLAPHLAELAFVAGAGPRLVATVAYSDYPPAAAALPIIGDAFRVDLERLVAARPDVVLAWAGGNPVALIEAVEALGIPVVALRTDTLDDIGAQLRAIGDLARTRATAETAAEEYERRLAALRARYAGRDPVRVFYEVAHQPLFTVGRAHSLNDAIRLCGGTNVFEALVMPGPSVSVESVLGADPEVIIGALYPPPPDGELGELSEWLRWPGVDAVADGHGYTLDPSVMARPTPRLLDGVARLCELIDRAR